MRKGDRVWVSNGFEYKWHVIRTYSTSLCGLYVHPDFRMENREDNLLPESCCKACLKLTEK
jgi:hypothetical protein